MRSSQAARWGVVVARARSCAHASWSVLSSAAGSAAGGRAEQRRELTLVLAALLAAARGHLADVVATIHSVYTHIVNTRELYEKFPKGSKP